MSKVRVELTDDGKRILIEPQYTLQDLRKIKEIRGRLKPTEKRPYWTVRADLQSARDLRQVLGARMQLGPKLRIWARGERDHERNLRRLHSADDAELLHTPQLFLDVIEGKAIKGLPKPLNRPRPARPYQRADIKMMSMANVINANQVGTGKTLEVVGALYEAQLDQKQTLIVSPLRTLVNTWQVHFERYTRLPVFTSESPTERKLALRMFADHDGPAVLCLIADDLRLTRYHNARDPLPQVRDPLHACKDIKGNWYRYRDTWQMKLYQKQYGAFVVDEFQRTGLNTRTSLFAISAGLIRAERIWLPSATPTGGKPRRFWPLLNLIAPQEYRSEWAWIGQWLEVEEEEFYGRGGKRQTTKKVGDIKPERADEFQDYHKKHLVRRLKKDALPGVPDAIELTVPTPMLPAQERMYREFDLNHETVDDQGNRLSGAGVLAVYTRLRSFSSIANGVSGKIEPLLEDLDQNGIRRLEPELGARAYVGCVEKQMVAHVVEVLSAFCDVDALTGDTKDSKPIIDRFNSTDSNPYVIVMTVQTGGVGIDLQPAGSAHLIDETWDPDETEQFFGRGDRGSRTTPLRCYVYQTPNSIQEYVAAVCQNKRLTNRTIMKYAPKIEQLRRRTWSK